MLGIHLSDIGKLRIRIANGIKDKKKIAPSNMAKGSRNRALATRTRTKSTKEPEFCTQKNER